MSLLIFNIDDNGIVLLNDTLAYDDDGEPLHWYSKAIVLPHLRMAVTVTGRCDLAAAWVCTLNAGTFARSIDELGAHTTAELRRIADELGGEWSRQGATSSVYHFGRADDGWCWWVFRSPDFEPERYGHATAVKPQPVDPDSFEMPTTIDEMIGAAYRLRAEQDALHAAGRAAVRIGGELWLTSLTDAGIMAQLVHQFPDRDAHWQQMLDARQAMA